MQALSQRNLWILRVVIVLVVTVLIAVLKRSGWPVLAPFVGGVAFGAAITVAVMVLRARRSNR